MVFRSCLVSHLLLTVLEGDLETWKLRAQQRLWGSRGSFLLLDSYTKEMSKPLTFLGYCQTFGLPEKGLDSEAKVSNWKESNEQDLQTGRKTVLEIYFDCCSLCLSLWSHHWAGLAVLTHFSVCGWLTPSHQNVVMMWKKGVYWAVSLNLRVVVVLKVMAILFKRIPEESCT